MIGRTLSHFEITAKIDEGGVGEVYRARDTDLGRDVAIKVLPEALTGDPERLQRFAKEAKILASLNHPNIATIYEVGESAGVHFLAMELIPGETLAEHIADGPIPVEEALPIALQIAEALEAAHQGDIVHRDLKPANVMLGRERGVKVLDFGLAKEGGKRGDTTPDLSRSPTLTAEMTQAGDDRFEVENPGLLPFGLMVEDLPHGVSKLRNRIIGRVFHALGLIEQWGSGIQRMTAACREAGVARCWATRLRVCSPVPDHSPKFWLTVQSPRRGARGVSGNGNSEAMAVSSPGPVDSRSGDGPERSAAERGRNKPMKLTLATGDAQGRVSAPARGRSEREARPHPTVHHTDHGRGRSPSPT